MQSMTSGYLSLAILDLFNNFKFRRICCLCRKSNAPITTCAVIPAAGLGSRFYPYTKLIPKELLPINNRPAIDFALDEIVQAQIKNLCLVTSPTKQIMLEYLNKYSSTLKLKIEKQSQPKGLGHAVFLTKKAVEEFSVIPVLLPDNIFVGSTNITQVLINQFLSQDCCAAIALVEVPPETVKNYGIANPEHLLSPERQSFILKNLVEKPAIDQAPSNFAVMGRYVFSPCIFDALDNLETGALGEIQLTDAINKLIFAGKKVLGIKITEQFFDVGNLNGWLEANNSIVKQQGRYYSL